MLEPTGERELDRIAAGIAHEIRNPIGAMRLKAENALLSDDIRRRAALEMMLGQIDRLDVLLKDLLTLTHRSKPRRQRANVPALLAAVPEFHRDVADSHGIKLLVQGPAMTWLLNPAEIDHERARGGEDPANECEPAPIRELLRRRDLRVFLASVVLFHFGNAAMLPMAGQVLAQKHPGSDTIALSACIIAAQFVMVGVAWAIGRASAKGVGRKTIFLVAMAVLPVRGVLFTLADSPYAVVGIQLLDGVAAGIFGVIAVLIASDLMRGTGRFNFAQGLVALSVGIGAALSNATAGYVVQWFGFTTGFLYLAAIAGCGLTFFAAFMPETKDPSVNFVASEPAAA